MIIARSSAAKRCILSFLARQMGRVRMDFHLHREHPCVSAYEADSSFAGYRRRFFSLFFCK